MKLTVIGFGQCGGRIADEFTRLNRRARSLRGIEIILDAFAVNSDTADLVGITSISPDYDHRILIGGRAKGHGAAKIGERGAEMARADSDRVISALRDSRRFPETDAILMIAATGGGTGSGAMPVMAQALRERYGSRKPIYCMAVLPFEHEQEAEARTVINTALCLKSSYEAADAVILVDNQRFLSKDATLKYNTTGINRLIVEPFYNLLCAGEERRAKRIGTRVLDAADIAETIKGWTAIGYGKVRLHLIKLPFESNRNYRKASLETHRGIQAMEEAIAELSIHSRTETAGKCLYLVSAPASEMTPDLVRDLNDFLRDIAPEAVLRAGDYPDNRGVVDVVVVVSQLREIDKVTKYYAKAAALLRMGRDRQERAARVPMASEDEAADLPVLL